MLMLDDVLGPFTNHQYLLHIVQALRMIINPIAHETFNKAIRHKTQNTLRH